MQIPAFRLPASTGQTLGLESFRGKVPMVLVFLDIDSERDRALLGEIDSRLRQFGSERSQILVVLRLTAKSARHLADEMGLSVPVLADASGAMMRDFAVEENGGQRRVAIVADKEARLVRRFDPIPEGDSADEIVDALLYAVRAIGSGTLDSDGR